MECSGCNRIQTCETPGPLPASLGETLILRWQEEAQGCYACRAMHDPLPEHQDFIHSEEFLRRLMRRQLRLSIACAGAFMLVLLGLPLMNYFQPDLMATRIGGFTLSWLILGVLFFPFVWIISGVFIKKSLRMEAEEAQLAVEENKRRSAQQ